MKKNTFLAIIAFSTSFVNAQWQQTNYSFNGYFFTSQQMATNGTDVYVCNDSSGTYRTTDNGNTWNTVNGLPPMVEALAINGTNIFAGGDGIYLSTNNGSSWSHLTNGLPTGISITSFAISGTNIFAGVESIVNDYGIYLSTNNGSSWVDVSNGLPNDKITSLAISGTNIFAGTYSSGIFLSTNNGSNWTAANGTVFSGDRITALAVKNSNVFATSSSSGSEGVYMSTNNGSSWTAVNNGISYSQYCIFYALAISGSNIFVGGFSGMYGNVVYLSNDDGSNWNNFSSGLLFNAHNTESLVINDTYIFAGMGGGTGTVWRRSLSEITGIENINNNKGIVIFPNPAQNEITIQKPITTTNSLISIKNIQGQELIKENINQNTTTTIDISKLENGVYFLNLQNEKENYVKKIVIQK